jgi:hypothetical protein
LPPSFFSSQPKSAAIASVMRRMRMVVSFACPSPEFLHRRMVGHGDAGLESSRAAADAPPAARSAAGDCVADASFSHRIRAARRSRES